MEERVVKKRMRKTRRAGVREESISRQCGQQSQKLKANQIHKADYLWSSHKRRSSPVVPQD